MTALDAPPSPVAGAAAAVRRLGRFELRRLVGRSACAMAWRAFDPRAGQDMLLVLPRRPPADAGALAAWLDDARLAARVSHPNLAHAVEVGEAEHWPYIAYDGAVGETLVERTRARDGDAPVDVARWVAQAALGLAFAHDAGLAHHDLQPWLLALGENGTLRVLGLGVVGAAGTEPAAGRDAAARQAQRDGAERDVLALAIVLHGLVTGTPALDEPDLGLALGRLVPLGRETLRLPWDLPRPVPDVLRAIANRATDRQLRQRYRSARTFARALEGFVEGESAADGAAHAQLIERVRQIGALPALPGAAARAARLALMEREHTEELAQVVLRDPALGFELLRAVNSAQVRGTQVAGNGPVLTVRRAIAMVGLDGVRRVALGLRDWPGPLDAAGARELEAAIARAMRAARVAQSLRPAGYDAEVVALVTLMQNLGRLVVQYHFPDDMRQVRRLMQPAPAVRDGEADEPGLSEQAASFAVLGGDIEAMGAAVARWWGMDDAVLHMIRRLSVTATVRSVDTDDDMLRAVGSAANEAVDVLALSADRQAAAIERVAQRYARVLAITARDVAGALQASSGVAAAVAQGDRDER
ncbi:MAG TPA: HDOD domain-containing protein [Burkholderiaceae bacterium]|nr:HDOD domain-containing protein [Burkholderiaceae bacterium]